MSTVDSDKHRSSEKERHAQREALDQTDPPVGKAARDIKKDRSSNCKMGPEVSNRDLGRSDVDDHPNVVTSLDCPEEKVRSSPASTEPDGDAKTWTSDTGGDSQEAVEIIPPLIKEDTRIENRERAQDEVSKGEGRNSFPKKAVGDQYVKVVKPVSDQYVKVVRDPFLHVKHHIERVIPHINSAESMGATEANDDALQSSTQNKKPETASLDDDNRSQDSPPKTKFQNFTSPSNAAAALAYISDQITKTGVANIHHHDDSNTITTTTTTTTTTDASSSTTEASSESQKPQQTLPMDPFHVMGAISKFANPFRNRTGGEAQQEQEENQPNYTSTEEETADISPTPNNAKRKKVTFASSIAKSFATSVFLPDEGTRKVMMPEIIHRACEEIVSCNVITTPVPVLLFLTTVFAAYGMTGNTHVLRTVPFVVVIKIVAFVLTKFRCVAERTNLPLGKLQWARRVVLKEQERFASGGYHQKKVLIAGLGVYHAVNAVRAAQVMTGKKQRRSQYDK